MKRWGNSPACQHVQAARKHQRAAAGNHQEASVQEAARRLGTSFGIVDVSLAPTPEIGDSVSDILELIGVDRTGAPGTIAALALLTDAVKKGGAMASSAVGGFSGAFLPVSEDQGMISAVEDGALSLATLTGYDQRLFSGLRHGRCARRHLGLDADRYHRR